MKDTVEVFFDEEEGIASTENAVAMNVSLFVNKFKGNVPLPKKFAPSWSVPLRSDNVEVGGSKVEVAICRPALVAKNGLPDSVSLFLSTVDPATVDAGATMSCTVDGTSHSVKEGEDFWLSAAAKVKATKAVSYL